MNDAHIKLTEEIYLRWFNDYLTLDTFAERHYWSTAATNFVISAGRTINHMRDSGLDITTEEARRLAAIANEAGRWIDRKENTDE